MGHNFYDVCGRETMAPNGQWMNEWSVALRKVEIGSSVVSQKWCHIPPPPPPAVYKTSSEQESYRMARLRESALNKSRHFSLIHHEAPFRPEYSELFPLPSKLCDIPSPTLAPTLTRGFLRGTCGTVMCLMLPGVECMSLYRSRRQAWREKPLYVPLSNSWKREVK